MATGDIYVQVTATAEASQRAKSIVVLVPGKIVEDCRTAGKKTDERAIAQHLADPVAMYLFTHRASFGRFRVARSFSPTPPAEIEGELPEFTRGDLKAWVL
ncbi:MAG TPA: hypothetical protein VE242_04365 [Chthoniobacterales bacterium]|nr:hypothetical protein [Chthoniobacterales bacterium]